MSNAYKKPEYPCELSDVEIVYKNVETIYKIDEEGEGVELKETYEDESSPKYYYCTNCQTDWIINIVQTKEQAFALVKEHLNA